MQLSDFHCSSGEKGSFVSIWKRTVTQCTLRASKRRGVTQSCEVGLPNLLNSPVKNEGDILSYLFSPKKPQPSSKAYTLKKDRSYQTRC